VLLTKEHYYPKWSTLF